MTIRKVFGAAATELGPRRVRVQCSSGAVDRTGEIVEQAGVSYAASLPVLWNHDPAMPIGRAYPARDGSGNLCAEVEFAPEGVSPKADEICGLVKAGVVDTVSIGFDPMDMEPMNPAKPKGPQKYMKAEWLELSFVSVPANRDAQVTERSLHTKGNESEWKVGASKSLPASDEESWDGLAAAKAMLDAAGFDGDDPDSVKARKGFLAYDSANPDLRGSYKLPFADIIDGKLTVTKGGVKAAASRLPQTAIPQDVKDKAEKVLAHYKEKLGMGESGKGAGARVTKAAVKKGLYQCSNLANILADLAWLEDVVEWEAECEGDGSPLPKMLADIMRAMGEALIAMTAEEVAELLGEEEAEEGAQTKFRAAVGKAMKERNEPKWVLRADKPLSKEVVDRIRAQWEEFMANPARKAVVLEPGVTFEPVTKSGKTISAATADKLKAALSAHEQALEHHKEAVKCHKSGMECIKGLLEPGAEGNASDDGDTTTSQSTGAVGTDGNTSGKSHSRRQREADLLALAAH